MSITKKLIHRPMDVKVHSDFLFNSNLMKLPKENVVFFTCKVFHPFRQRPLVNNPCENNGGCQSLCLLSPEDGRICACPENFILNDDQTSCTSNCTTAQFVCENASKCIPKWWKCDGQVK